MKERIEFLIENYFINEDGDIQPYPYNRKKMERKKTVLLKIQ